jgi:glycine/D-amino acid oxidase-like deaminating enzyme
MQYRPIQGAVPGGHRDGREWTAFVMNAPRYMQYLAERARSAGIPLIKKRISSLDEAYDLPEVGRVEVVINATGLGAQTLIGVEDPKVYPGRGQTILVETPKDTKRVCLMSTEDFYSKMDGQYSSPLILHTHHKCMPHGV